MLEWLKEPGFLGTHATVGADMSQLMATIFTGLFVIGWIQARNRRADAHHWMMFGGMIAMLAFFMSYYLFRQLGVLAFEGKEGFGGAPAPWRLHLGRDAGRVRIVRDRFWRDDGDDFEFAAQCARRSRLERGGAVGAVENGCCRNR